MWGEIIRLQPPQVILFRFLGWSLKMRRDAGTVTVSVILRWFRCSGGVVGPLHLLTA